MRAHEQTEGEHDHQHVVDSEARFELAAPYGTSCRELADRLVDVAVVWSEHSPQDHNGGIKQRRGHTGQ